ncbi:hypothetical protein JYU14_00145 [Simkania negevensis]|uniref:Uncharacterized protein n=1 Tax=Simkania negevensis TaxID=83561 RepID=A0ABS3AQE1_9BACT|nr:hypothetical protein [Simkania negevensis]
MSGPIQVMSLDNPFYASELAQVDRPPEQRSPWRGRSLSAGSPNKDNDSDRTGDLDALLLRVFVLQNKLLESFIHEQLDKIEQNQGKISKLLELANYLRRHRETGMDFSNDDQLKKLVAEVREIDPSILPDEKTLSFDKNQIESILTGCEHVVKQLNSRGEIDRVHLNDAVQKRELWSTELSKLANKLHQAKMRVLDGK